ncbi:ROK family glucokinase [Candidatus Nomurabacteria bacterium]|nr:ROK family glucokinase [Candidatus Nomurabacteria bacterium]
MDNNKYTIGIDLGGTNIAAGVVDGTGRIVSKYNVPTNPRRHYTEIIADMAFAAEKACEISGISPSDTEGIGIGSPGTVDSANGIVIYTNNINFDNTPMRDEMQKHIDLPVFISNDANCAALGETADTGAAKGLKNVILITLGTGLGGGIIIDGKIYEGEHGAGAELGHTVISVDGPQCTCGRRGCWECYSSATGLIRMTSEALARSKSTLMWDMIGHDITRISGRTAFEASRKNDPLALKVVYDYIRYLSEGIVNMMNIFRPEVFLIGGGICNEGDYLFIPLREFVAQSLYGGNRVPTPPIMKAKLGNEAGIIGASMLALKR